MMLLNPYRYASAPAGTTDPYWADVVSLLHFDGGAGDSVFTDAKGLAWTPSGELVTLGDHALFGSGGSFGSGATLLSATNSALAFGTGDFTVEFWHYPQSLGTNIILDCREGIDTDTKPVIYNVNADLYYYVNGANVISATGVLAANVPHRIAVSRVSGVTRMFVDGAQVGSSWADATNYDNQRFRLSGNRIGSTNFFVGFLDEWRATKAGRYATSYTLATAPFPNG